MIGVIKEFSLFFESLLILVQYGLGTLNISGFEVLVELIVNLVESRAGGKNDKQTYHKDLAQVRLHREKGYGKVKKAKKMTDHFRLVRR